VSCFSATLDSIIDAYRIELLSQQHLGSGAAIESLGFRLGMLTSGAGALYLANSWGWSTAYLSMSLCCFIGLFAILASDEPQQTSSSKTRRWQHASSIPLSLFFSLLGFIFFFKLI